MTQVRVLKRCLDFCVESTQGAVLGLHSKEGTQLRPEVAEAGTGSW